MTKTEQAAVLKQLAEAKESIQLVYKLVFGTECNVDTCSGTVEGGRPNGEPHLRINQWLLLFLGEPPLPWWGIVQLAPGLIEFPRTPALLALEQKSAGDFFASLELAMAWAFQCEALRRTHAGARKLAFELEVFGDRACGQRLLWETYLRETPGAEATVVGLGN